MMPLTPDLARLLVDDRLEWTNSRTTRKRRTDAASKDPRVPRQRRGSDGPAGLVPQDGVRATTR